ncbi:MAG: hypothetical protein C5B50_20655 [Verrucomicrobia bacterium]|nr:MAG: hypothetical protein C5B50_20655 [Verrucomicrobiota bacterium]
MVPALPGERFIVWQLSMTNPKTKTPDVCEANANSGLVTRASGPMAALFAGLFGAFLGLGLLKFGDPVLAEKWPQMNLPGLMAESGESAPRNIYEFLLSPNWPMVWGYFGLVGVSVIAIASVAWGRRGSGVKGQVPSVKGHVPSVKRQVSSVRSRGSGVNWVAALPLAWLVWEVVAGSRTVDRGLTEATLAHFSATVVCFYLGFFCLSRVNSTGLFWSGIFCGFMLMLAVGVDQHFGGLERFRRFFFHQQELYGHGQEIPANLLKKINSNRIYGTLFYPNALAGALLLLLPGLLAWLPRIRAVPLSGMRERPTPIHLPEPSLSSRWPQLFSLILVLAAAAWLYLATDSKVSLVWLLITGFAIVAGAPAWFVASLLSAVSLACLIWSGSKGGWLLMLLLGLVALLQLRFSKSYKIAVVAVVLALGLAGFFLKYASFFHKGATSVVARFDYWRAAVQTATTHPLLGTGPGTFFIAYQNIKKPESEPARLAHNDYLEQVSDSGLPGLFLYAGLIFGGLFCARPRTLDKDVHPNGAYRHHFAIWLGVLGWALQGLFEFGLYIPALAWPAFALLGWLLGKRES